MNIIAQVEIMRICYDTKLKSGRRIAFEIYVSPPIHLYLSRTSVSITACHHLYFMHRCFGMRWVTLGWVLSCVPWLFLMSHISVLYTCVMTGLIIMVRFCSILYLLYRPYFRLSSFIIMNTCMLIHDLDRCLILCCGIYIFHIKCLYKCDRYNFLALFWSCPSKIETDKLWPTICV